MGGKGSMEWGGEGCKEREMYARDYTLNIWWEKGSRWRDSDTDVPMCSNLHTYSWPRTLVHKNITIQK